MAIKKTVALPKKKSNAKKISKKLIVLLPDKKTSAKKSSASKKELIIASADECFWVNDGPALQSLLGLREAFKTLTKAQFSYHLNKEKNDFSNWILFVLKDEKCSKDLLKAKNMKNALSVIEQHLKGYDI